MYNYLNLQCDTRKSIHYLFTLPVNVKDHTHQSHLTSPHPISPLRLHHSLIIILPRPSSSSSSPIFLIISFSFLLPHQAATHVDSHPTTPSILPPRPKLINNSQKPQTATPTHTTTISQLHFSKYSHRASFLIAELSTVSVWHYTELSQGAVLLPLGFSRQ